MLEAIPGPYGRVPICPGPILPGGMLPYGAPLPWPGMGFMEPPMPGPLG